MSYEQILTLLESLPPEQADFKSKLLGPIKELNQEKGKAAADILKLKPQIDALQKKLDEGEQQTSKYKDIAEALAKAGVEAKDADALMEKLNIKKSIEDENSTLKALLEEKEGILKTFETQKQQQERMEKVNPLFQEALGEFIKAKQAEGKHDYQLTDKFVDKEALYKEVDIDNDTLRNDHFTKVLNEADKAQQTFMESTGMGFTKQVHNQNMTQGHFSGKTGINDVATEQIRKVQENQGSLDSVVQGIAQIHAAQQKS